MWTEINGTGLVLLNVPRPIVYGGWVHSYREHDLGMWGTLSRAQPRVAPLEKMVPETEYKLVIKPTRTHECGPE